MRKLIATFFSVLLILSLIQSTYASNNAFLFKNEVPDSVYKAASNGFDWISGKLISAPEKWELPAKTSKDDLSLGKGYQINLIERENISAFKSKSLLKQLSEKECSSNQWLFTINVADNPVMYMIIGYDEGSYQVLEYGGDARNYGKTLAKMNSLGLDSEPMLLSFDRYYYFAYDQGRGMEIVATDPEDSKNLTAYSKNSFISPSVFEKAIIATCKYGEELTKEAGGETIYGAGGIRPPKETGYTINNHIVYASAAVAVVLFFGGFIIYRKHF